MGDLNAKIGADNTGYEQVMGKHGLGRMNENGEQFADFCAQNNLVRHWGHVLSNTGASIKQRGDHPTTSKKIRSTMCVYAGGSGVLYSQKRSRYSVRSPYDVGNSQATPKSLQPTFYYH